MTTLLLGTTNSDKLREMTTLLAELPFELRPLTAYPHLRPPAETGTTYKENARLKATYYAREAGLPTVAEDSGFEVDALGGEPGVGSARFLGASATYPERFDEIYRRVGERRAGGSPVRFVCALVLASQSHVIFETRQTVEGRLAPAPRGTNGFGYDPIFYFPPLDRTLAELTEAEKSVVSHRGKAIRALKEFVQGRDVLI